MSTEIFQFRALLKSRSNIFVHGPNGSGKTTFTRDCIDIQTKLDGSMGVFIDCIESYSEKLIAIQISSQLNNMINNFGSNLEFYSKEKKEMLTLNKPTRAIFGFRPCKTMDQLHEALRKFNEERIIIKEKVLKAIC